MNEVILLTHKTRCGNGPKLNFEQLPNLLNENNAAFSEAGVNKIFHDYLEKSLFSNENESFKMYTHQANSLLRLQKIKILF